MKHCKSCQLEKPLSDFYKHSIMKDGYRTYCKQCMNEKEKEYRSTAAGKIARSKEKQYPDAKKRYKQSDKGKLKAKEYNRPKGRLAAINAVAYAIRTKKLVRQPCQVCGQKSEAHHWSYLPEHRLDVIWLCKKHHNKLHVQQANLKSWVD